jgi:hypothetical protein
MVLPRPLILAVAGLVLLLLSFVVVQRGRTVTDSPAVAQRTPAPVDRQPAVKAEPKDNPGVRREARRPDRPASTAPAAPAAPAVPDRGGVPARAARALEQGRVIAVLFTLEEAADDSATRAALRSLKTGPGKSRVAVFSDSIANVGRYSRLVGGLGISQVPSIVIVDSERQARLLEGYVDAGTLRQSVADAQR